MLDSGSNNVRETTFEQYQPVLPVRHPREGPRPGYRKCKPHTLSTRILCLPQDTLAEQTQDLEPDILEDTEHIQTMTPEEIEETIDYIINEVLSSFVITTDFSLTYRIGYSMGETLLVTIWHLIGSVVDLHCLAFQIFPPHVIEAARRYRFDEKVKNDLVEHRRIYEELKVEATLLVTVRIPTLPTPGSILTVISLELPVR